MSATAGQDCGWSSCTAGRSSPGCRSHGALGAGEATTLGVDLCRALAAVHSAGLVHGDVKAQNVMREDGGRTVLMDFGAGRVQGAHVAALAGTPLYLAPEVLAGEPATPRSDIYSLGVLLFHLLTGSYPYSASDLDGLRAAHADGTRALLRDLRPDLPDELVHAVHRALEADPARRFATAGEMEQGLALALAQALNPVRFRSAWVIAAAATLAAALSRLLVALPRSSSRYPARSSPSPFSRSSCPDSVDERPALAGLTTDVVRELQRFDVAVKDATKAGRVSADVDLELDADVVVHTELKSGDRTVVNVAVRRAGGSVFFGTRVRRVRRRAAEQWRAPLPRISRPQSAPLRARGRLRPRSRPTTRRTPRISGAGCWWTSAANPRSGAASTTSMRP